MARFRITLCVLLSILAFPLPLEASSQASSRVANGTRRAHGPSYVALTFDDGPSTYTPSILSILRSFRIHATFFVIGQNVSSYPSLVKAEVADGNEIGNHTYTHADLRYLSDSSIVSELRETQNAVWSAARVKPRWFRPPGGDTDGRVVQVAATLGLRQMLWNVDPRDWSLPGTNAIVATVLAQVRPGSVILMHDGGGNRSETVAALPIIVRSLEARGYSFLTVSQLYGMPAPSSCTMQVAAKWFASAGVSPQPTHAIYKAWLADYCSGKNLGPATSGEYTLSRGVIAQDFARTAHRMQWTARTGTITVTRVRRWATAVFEVHGIKPRRHTPITHSWYHLFYKGYNKGPAIGEPYTQSGVTKQCFQRSCATAVGDKVTWKAE